MSRVGHYTFTADKEPPEYLMCVVFCAHSCAKGTREQFFELHKVCISGPIDTLEDAANDKTLQECVMDIVDKRRPEGHTVEVCFTMGLIPTGGHSYERYDAVMSYLSIDFPNYPGKHAVEARVTFHPPPPPKSAAKMGMSTEGATTDDLVDFGFD
jgi:hypothetical protein